MRLNRTLLEFASRAAAYRSIRQSLLGGVWKKSLLFKDFLFTKYQGVLNRINCDKIYNDLTNAQQARLTYIAMVIVSANIATLGLLMNNAPVIIGAMIISPLMGPIMAGGLSFALGDYTLGKKVIKSVLLGIGLSLAFSTLITVLSPMKSITPEILARTAPTILDMIIAIFCGVAGTLSVLFDNLSGSIFGVAISVALMPPLCVVGIGIGMGKINIAIGSLFMFLTNLSAIFIASAILFLSFGFYTYHSLLSKRQIISKYGLSLGLLILVSIPLFYTLNNAINNKALYDKINNVLVQGFNTENRSKIVSWNLDNSRIMVTVDSLSYIAQSTISQVSTEINTTTGRQYTIDVTQIPVFSLSQNGKQSVSSALLNVLSGKALAKNTPDNSQNNDSWLQEKLAYLVKIFPYVDYYRTMYDQENNVAGISVLLNPGQPVTTDQANEVIRYLSTNTNNITIQVFVFSNSILVPPVYFAEDRYDVGQNYLQGLNALSAFLKSQPQYNVKIAGRTDGTGSVYINEYLSRKRAEAVRNYLAQAGVPLQRLSVSPEAGTSNAAGEADQGRQSERRVDLQLIPAQVPASPPAS